MKYHDSTQIVGVVQAVQETPDALLSRHVSAQAATVTML
jgi:hypothetical protein